MNIKFHYLYRDGANYKQNSSEVFSNIAELQIAEIENSIRSCLIEENWFYAHKWNLKDCHLHKWDDDIDHAWHEYDCIEFTNEGATIGDISEFIDLIRNH